MKIFNKQNFLCLLIISFFAVPLFVLAQGATPENWIELAIPLPGAEGGKVQNIAQYVNLAYQFGIYMLATLCVLSMMIAGIIYITSRGSGGIQTAKNMMKGTLIGLVLGLFSYLILNTINPELTNLSPPVITAIDRLAFTDTSIPARGTTDIGASCVDGSHCKSGYCSANVCADNQTACSPLTETQCGQLQTKCVWEEHGACIPIDPNDISVDCEGIKPSIKNMCGTGNFVKCKWTDDEVCARRITPYGGIAGITCVRDGDCSQGLFCVDGTCGGGDGICKNKPDFIMASELSYCIGGTAYECETNGSTCDSNQGNDKCCKGLICSNDTWIFDTCMPPDSADPSLGIDTACIGKGWLDNTGLPAGLVCSSGRLHSCVTEGSNCDLNDNDLEDLCCPGLICDSIGYNKCVKK